MEYKDTLVTEELKNRVPRNTTIEEKRAVIENVLENRLCVLIVFDVLTPRIFVQWLLTLRKSNGNEPGIGVYRSNRSALKHLFGEFETPNR